MQSKQFEQLESCDNLFRQVLSGNLGQEDPELRAIPEYNDLSRREPEPDADESRVRSLIPTAKEICDKLEKGEFKITKIEHTNYGPDSEILSQINEQTYSISYRSNFGDISTDHERIVDQSLQEDAKDNSGNPIERTITDAINKSMPGDTILVKTGEYNESIILDRSICIKRFDENSKVELNSVKGDAICLRTNCARIVGITISCSTPGDTYCVRSNIGILELEGCNLNSRCAGCVRLEHNARISAKDCTLHTNMFTSTSLMPGSKAVFDNCNFERPDGELRPKQDEASTKISRTDRSIPSITIDVDATCIVVNSRKIESSILFKPHSKGMIKGSTISSLTSGIIVQDSAQPLITGCTIHGCKNGIQLEGRSLGVFIGNTIVRNEIGVYATGAKNFIMRDNVIDGSTSLGIRLAQGTFCTFEGGSIINGGHNGIQIDNRAQVTIKNMVISENHKSGLMVEPTLTLNQSEADQACLEASYAKLLNCNITKNGEFGVSSRSGLKIVIVNSKIKENKIAGLRAEHCHTEIHSCEIYDNLTKEIILFEDASIVANDCIFGNRPLLPGQPTQELTKEEQQKVSLFLKDNSSCALNKCQWIGLTSSRSLFLTNTSRANLSFCKFIDINAGVFITDDAQCIITDNSEFILPNESAASRRAIILSKQGNVKIFNSRFKQGTVSIETVQGGILEIGNTVFENIKLNALKLDEATVQIHESQFEVAGSTANILAQGSNVFMSKVTLIGAPQQRSYNTGITNSKLGLAAFAKVDKDTKKVIKVADVTIESSEFNSFSEDGIKIQNGTKLTVSSCKFQKCGREAINADNQCVVKLNNPIFDQNTKILTLARNCKGEIYGPVSQTNYFVDASSSILAPDLKE